MAADALSRIPDSSTCAALIGVGDNTMLRREWLMRSHQVLMNSLQQLMLWQSNLLVDFLSAMVWL